MLRGGDNSGFAPRVTPRPLLQAVLVAAILIPPTTFRSDSHPLVPPATLRVVPTGWQVFTGNPNTLTRQGTSVETIITSWHWRVDSGIGPGNAVPRNGVLIDIQLFRNATNWRSTNLCETTPVLRGHPERKLPLRLPETTTFTSEGPPFMLEYRVFGRFDNSYNYEVRVDINNSHPSESTLKLASRIVSSIDFPAWPTAATC